MRGSLRSSSQHSAPTTLQAIGRAPACSPIPARSPSATSFPERPTCSVCALPAPPALAIGAIRSRIWPPSSSKPQRGIDSCVSSCLFVALFPKELTMNLENEILGIRTSLGRIEGRMDEIGKLSERGSTLEQPQAWLKGAWTVLAATCAYIWKAIYTK